MQIAFFFLSVPKHCFHVNIKSVLYFKELKILNYYFVFCTFLYSFHMLCIYVKMNKVV